MSQQTYQNLDDLPKPSYIPVPLEPPPGDNVGVQAKSPLSALQPFCWDCCCSRRLRRRQAATAAPPASSRSSSPAAAPTALPIMTLDVDVLDDGDVVEDGRGVGVGGPAEVVVFTIHATSDTTAATTAHNVHTRCVLRSALSGWGMQHDTHI